MDPLSRPIRPPKWKRNRAPLSQEVRSVYRVLVVTLAIMILVSTGTYLYVSGLQSAKGYTLKQLQMDNASLQSESRKLERRSVEAQSFLQIEGSELLKLMESPGKEAYYYINESGFAQKLKD